MARKIPFDDPSTLNIIRVSYVGVQLVVLAVYYFISLQIKKKNDQTVLKYVEPSGPMVRLFFRLVSLLPFYRAFFAAPRSSHPTQYRLPLFRHFFTICVFPSSLPHSPPSLLSKTLTLTPNRAKTTPSSSPPPCATMTWQRHQKGYVTCPFQSTFFLLPRTG